MTRLREALMQSAVHRYVAAWQIQHFFIRHVHDDDDGADGAGSAALSDGPDSDDDLAGAHGDAPDVVDLAPAEAAASAPVVDASAAAVGAVDAVEHDEPSPSERQALLHIQRGFRRHRFVQAVRNAVASVAAREAAWGSWADWGAGGPHAAAVSAAAAHGSEEAGEEEDEEREASDSKFSGGGAYEADSKGDEEAFEAALAAEAAYAEEHGILTDCVVCLGHPSTTILAPCGHQCVCRNCATVLLRAAPGGGGGLGGRGDTAAGARCPMCRARVESCVKRIYKL